MVATPPRSAAQSTRKCLVHAFLHCVSFFTFLFFAVFDGMAACAPDFNTEPALEFGFGGQVLQPTGLTGWDQAGNTVGLLAGIPLGPGSIQVAGYRGGPPRILVLMIEAGYRYLIPNPWAHFFIQAGVHQLSYEPEAVAKRSAVGPNFGFGLLIALSNLMNLQMGFRYYFRPGNVLSVSGGFLFRV